jgi:hypothetical protein
MISKIFKLVTGRRDHQSHNVRQYGWGWGWGWGRWGWGRWGWGWGRHM